MRRLLPLIIVGALAVPAAGSAQGFAIAGHAGSLGVGGSAILGLSQRVNLRGTFGFVPSEPEFDVDDVDFTVELPTFFLATVDLYPTSVFHISVGGLFVSNGGALDVTGEFTGTQEFGGNVYTGDEVGTLFGTFELKKAMPYVGIGFGNPINSRIGLNFDLGVGFGDVPTVELEADGPISNDPTFLSDLQDREDEFEDDIPEVLRYYPVISLSLSIGIGG